MNSKKITPPFTDKHDITKWDHLMQSIGSLDHKEMKKIEKIVLKKISSKDKKKLFVTLLAVYLKENSVRWDLIKKKIGSLQSVSSKKKVEDDKDKNEFIEMYINIGKDKKVFPQNLMQFIQQSMRIRDDQIKNIRIHENYSFFSIPKELGEKAKFLLSVKRFRGKNIIVNFSRNNPKK